MNPTPSADQFCSAVGREIVAATRAANQTTVRLTRCIQALVEGQEEHGVRLDVALPEIAATGEALIKSLAVRAAVIEARLAMVRWPERLGVAGYGTDCPCNDSERFRGEAPAPLRSVG